MRVRKIYDESEGIQNSFFYIKKKGNFARSKGPKHNGQVLISLQIMM